MATRDHPDWWRPVGGANSQESTLERRSWIWNNGLTPVWTYYTGNNRGGKFFPRGCRGFIHTIEIYCYDFAAAGGTITVYLAPLIGMGYLYTANVVVPPAGAPAWRAATFDIMWNYDSLFIWVVCSNAQTQYGYDGGLPYDDYLSTDAAITWASGDHRFWFRVVMRGETAGDVPVSGIINNIKIPHSAAVGEFAAVALPNNVETVVGDEEGAGYTHWILVEVSHSAVEIRVYCDGNQAWVLDPATMSALGYGATTPCITMLGYTEEGTCVVQLNITFEFRRIIEVRCFHTTGVAQAATVTWTLNLIR